MRKKNKPISLRAEFIRAALVLGVSSALGFGVNAVSSHSLPLFSDPSAAEPAGASAADVPRVTMEDLSRAWNDAKEAVLIVDVRGPAEFDTGHVPRSIHAPLETILDSRAEIDGALSGATLIVAMCDSDDCSKADTAAEALVKLGYKNVRVLAGGFEAYKRSGYQIEETRH